jgi:methylmalonyl-CoA mutase C-terminal domain/subunit
MAHRKTRILLGKLGEGYRDALFNLAEAFREAGFEVVFTDLQDPEAIVRSAIQESVDHIGITILPGAGIQAFSEIRDILKREDVGYITITAGGFLDEKDVPVLKDMGVMEFFPRGTSWETLIEWSRKHIEPKDD